MGEFSRALAVLLESPPADFSQATFDRITALMPDVEESLGELHNLPTALKCDEDTLVKVLRKTQAVGRTRTQWPHQRPHPAHVPH